VSRKTEVIVSMFLKIVGIGCAWAIIAVLTSNFESNIRLSVFLASLLTAIIIAI